MIADNTTLIEARDLCKSFDRGKIPVIRGIDVRIVRGEITALWGASGSGKSTLLHLLSGLDAPDSGRISILGYNPGREADRLELRRRHVGFVFQLHNLIPDLTVEENLAIPAVACGQKPGDARPSASSPTRSACRTAANIASRISPAANGSAPPFAAPS